VIPFHNKAECLFGEEHTAAQIFLHQFWCVGMFSLKVKIFSASGANQIDAVLLCFCIFTSHIFSKKRRFHHKFYEWENKKNGGESNFNLFWSLEELKIIKKGLSQGSRPRKTLELHNSSYTAGQSIGTFLSHQK
jgi:hypothetical protein